MKNIVNLRSSKVRMFCLFIVDVLTIILNAYISLILRYELHFEWIPETYIQSIERYMWINILTTIILFMVLKLYRSVWTYASINEFVRIFGACILSVAFQALGMTFLVLEVPRSYYLFDFFLLLMTTTATRFSYRALRIVKQGVENTGKKVLNTMVIGAGEAGNMIIQELKYSKHLNRRVCCIIDDNPSKRENIFMVFRLLGIETPLLTVQKNIMLKRLFSQSHQQMQRQRVIFCAFVIRRSAN